ncbi:hypothetical protein [Rhodanobacter sp. DHG33]|uniref:hypothetical protein n=1 Tax=Rhodanobacter sp. DHG33 TaxID=2775921 RepID=UPI001786297F|nr:hypothetical protein [Rhodanobacter sp. DHG33]MBD8898574.1 hypothetical protein [Rhodanobacter sp. DHG33]
MAEAFAGASDALLDDIVLQLDILQPDEETLLRLKYSRIHPGVVAAMARGASQRQILELLKLKGLELHHATLTKLYKAELTVRDERGERTCCVTCRQSLKAKEAGHTEASSDAADGIDGSEEVTE